MSQTTLPRAPLGPLTVARMGFGVMQLESRAHSHADAIAILRQAADAGVDHFDTASFYGDCNALIAEALGGRRDEIVIATKVGAVRDGEHRLIPAQRPEELRAQVEANLAELRTDHLDLVNLRRLDRPPGILADGDQLVDLDAQLAELIALRDAGTITAIGLSQVNAVQLTQALAAGGEIACVQNGYSVLERDSEPVLTACAQHRVAWAPYFPLGSALPGRTKVVEDPTVIRIAAEIDATPAQVGLAWLLAHYADCLLISGTANPAHLVENLAVAEISLDAEAMSALDALAAPPAPA